MPETQDLSIWESTFAKSDKTDAILVVEGKKLHVNKTILSYYSDYFNTLFNLDFKEKSMPEIEIKDVKFEDFATLLSLVQNNPIMPTPENAEKLLELADRFLLPIAKRHVELFLLTTDKNRMQKLRIGDRFQISELVDDGVELFEKAEYFKGLPENSIYQKLSDEIKRKLFYKMLTFI